MTTVSIKDAKNRLTELARLVEKGETVVVTRNGKYAYVTNTGSASISGYRIHADGRVMLLDADGVTGMTGGGPIDMALSRGSHFLYSLDSGARGISGFEVNRDGSLTPIGGASGLPAAAVGLAAR